MKWQIYLQLLIAAATGAALAWWVGDAKLLDTLAGGIIAVVLHAIPATALADRTGK